MTEVRTSGDVRVGARGPNRQEPTQVKHTEMTHATPVRSVFDKVKAYVQDWKEHRADVRTRTNKVNALTPLRAFEGEVQVMDSASSNPDPLINPITREKYQKASDDEVGDAIVDATTGDDTTTEIKTPLATRALDQIIDRYGVPLPKPREPWRVQKPRLSDPDPTDDIAR